ncbi:hypothetical protein FK513_31050, partial [Klebsiella pneumoniae]|nr:hypothetical protein [Klebsiella pneumoniae]
FGLFRQVADAVETVDAIKAKKQDPSGAFVWTTYAALQSLHLVGAEVSASGKRRALRPSPPPLEKFPRCPHLPLNGFLPI